MIGYGDLVGRAPDQAGRDSASFPVGLSAAEGFKIGSAPGKGGGAE